MIQTVIEQNFPLDTQPFTRVFHGRGGLYKGWEFLTIDCIDNILLIAYFNEPLVEQRNFVQTLAQTFFDTYQLEAIVIQERFLPKAPSQLFLGTLKEEIFAYENGLRYKLNLRNNQNNGFFADMKNGRKFIQDSAKDKTILNLFAYTCAFSVVSIKGGAKKVVNVDMSKGALSTGRTNHRINNLDTKNVQFMPYNILKSWSRIRKAGPYDIIIIDPPSFQKGSFASSTDYQKIIKRLHELASPTCTVLAALNNPALDSQFLKDIFLEYAPQFTYQRHLKPVDSFKSKEVQRGLKNLIFTI